MSTEKIYVVIPGELGWRKYTPKELVWLWKSGQLPLDATFQNETGESRPISELVNTLIELETRALLANRTETASPKLLFLGQRRRLVWVGLSIFLLVAMLCGCLILRDRSIAKLRQQEEQELLGREARMEDFVKSGEVVPGMTLVQVRRSCGEPKAMKSTADTSKQQWVYRQQTVIFENGVVTRIEPTR